MQLHVRINVYANFPELRYAIACTYKCIETRVLPFVFEQEGHRQFQGAQHQTLVLALVHWWEKVPRVEPALIAPMLRSPYAISGGITNFLFSPTHILFVRTLQLSGGLLQQSLVPSFDHLSCTKLEFKWTSPTFRLLTANRHYRSYEESKTSPFEKS